MTRALAVAWLVGLALAALVALVRRVRLSDLLAMRSLGLRWTLPIATVGLTVEAIAVLRGAGLLSGTPIVVALGPFLALALLLRAALLPGWRRSGPPGAADT